MSIVFDIETASLPDEQLRPIFEADYEPLPHPGEFDPASVKYGNTKDATKRAEKLKECQDAHTLAVNQYAETANTHRAEAWQSFLDRAALNPATGCVLAIGVRSIDSPKSFILGAGDEPEEKILADWWAFAIKIRAAKRMLIGHNILQFDLPFLIRRSWILGVEVPSFVRQGRYFSDCWIDTREVWLCGQRQNECSSSLGDVARSLGAGSKNGEGKEFGRLWRGTSEERQQAIAYLTNDLQMTAAVAQRMGVS